MKKLKKRIVAVLLAAALASQSMFVSASDFPEVPEISDAIVADVSGNDVSGSDEVIVDVSENDEEEVTDPIVTEPETPEVKDVSENDVPQVEDVSGNDVSYNDVSSNEETLGDDTWYNLPEGYIVLDEEMLNKKDIAANTIPSLQNAIPDIDYVESTVIALCDTEEEALLIAKAYGGELYSFGLGVAEIRLSSNVSVMEALSVAADTSLAMPNVYPDLLYQIDTADTEANAYLSDEAFVEEGIEISEEELMEIDNLAQDYFSDDYLKGNSSMYQWHHDIIGSAYAWKKGFTGQGIDVAVIDSGVASSHSDISVVKYYDCYNYYGKENAGYDDNGHGSHCAGIIGGRANGILGVGVAPSANIYSIKVLSSGGNGSDTAIIRGINQALDIKDTSGDRIIDVISMSIGGKIYNTAYNEPLTDCYNAGIVFVASAGNDGGSDANYPGNYAHVICVGATDKNNKRASFSTYCSAVDVAAPGVDIPSLKYNNSSAYVLMSGTSMATPVVAGEVAVLLSAASYLPTLDGKVGKYRVDAVEKLLKSSVISAGSGTGKGIPVLTKTFGMTDDSKTPSAPVIGVSLALNKQSASVSITSKSLNTIYYTTDGKSPSFKNGKLLYGTKYTGGFWLYGTSAAKYTIKAIEVNSVGKVSKVATKKITLVAPVQSISISGAVYVAPGKSTTYKATASPSYATNKKVKWSLAGTVPTGVKIDSKTGKLTVKSTVPESSTAFYVYAAAADGNGASQYYAVYIKKNRVKSLKFNSKSVTFTRNGSNITDNFFARLLAASTDGSTFYASDFFWSSSKPSVVSVSASGVITCLQGGTAKITVKPKDTSGKSASITVKVVQNMTGISINGASTIILAPGTSYKLTTAITPASTSNKKVKWCLNPVTQIMSSNGVKVDKAGKVTISKTAEPQTIRVYALSQDGTNLQTSKLISVSAGKVSSISLSAKSGYLFRNSGTFSSRTVDSFTYTVNGTGVFEPGVTVTNSAPGLVSLSVVGNKVTLTSLGTGSGTAKITITSNDGTKKSATYTLSVREPVTAVNIAPAKSGGDNFVTRGKSKAFTAKLMSEGKPSSTKVKWSIVSYYSGLSVNSKGTVKASKNASSYSDRYYLRADASDGSGAYAIYSLTVCEPSSYMYTYYNARTTYIAKVGYSYNISVYYNGGYYIDPNDGNKYYRVYVSSSNPKAIAVAKNGANGFTIVCNKKGKSTVSFRLANGKSIKLKFQAK